jgi:DNA-binding response OmpR family regulator
MGGVTVSIMETDIREQAEACRIESMRRVLLVDDDRQQTDALEFGLRQHQFDVVTAYSAAAAAAALANSCFDLIFLDIGLPDADGLKICSEWMDDPDHCDTPVIIVSGQDHADHVRQSRAAGGRFFVKKPYDPNVLLTLAEAILSGDVV